MTSGLRLPHVSVRFLTLLPIFVIGGFCSYLHAQSILENKTKSDTSSATKNLSDSTYKLSADSIKLGKVSADSSRSADTTRMSTPSLVGTFDRSLDSTKFLTKDDMVFLDYRYLGDILGGTDGVFVQNQFSIGGYDKINIRGGDWRSIAVTSNGRLLNDPASGIFNLYQFSTEYADRIEIITGPRAFLYGVNSASGAINLVTKNYNSNRPLSKLNYTETAYNYQYSDGTFSKNISRKVNFTFGFQHQSVDPRFTNSAHDAWNMRVKLRYNLSKNFNIILSEYLTSSETQLNGGIDVATTGITRLAFDRIYAVPINPDASDKITRHDVDLSLVGTLLGDTTNVSMLTLYYSNNLREYRDRQSSSNSVKIESDHRSSWMGALFTQDYHTSWQRFNVGANLELRQIEASPNLGRRRNSLGSIWAKEELIVDELVTVAGFARYDNFLRESNISAGSDASFKPFDWLSLYGGFSFSKRFPNYLERYWSDSTVSRTGSISSERHRSFELGARLHYDGYDLRVAFFHRTIENPVLFQPYGNFLFPGIRISNGDRLITNGIEATLRARIWILILEGTGQFITQQDEAGIKLSRLPKLSANGGVYFWHKLLNGNLDLKIGFKGNYVSGSQSEVFNPEVLAYIPNNGLRMGFGSSVDGFLIAGLGSAHIHLMWENLTNSQYFVTPYYPILDRAVKFGVSWQFLD
jgi:outer membrane cobalamin receptor